MRIRKRQAQLPFSSISPPPLSSDPNFNRSPVVQHPPLRKPPPPADHPNHPIRRQKPTQGRDSSAFPETTTSHGGEELKKKEDYLVLKQEGEEERGENGEKSNYTARKKNDFDEELGTGSLSLQGVGKWCEGEKAFPLKKRRGSFERIMQKKDDIINDHNYNSGKKKGRNGALMEGSRCSRVNGRGWRCCQQTLVGYSLCEHHLGKGRLRSITSVRSRSLGSNNNNNAGKKEEQPPLSKQEEKPLMTTTIKKRVKLGMVKARSISSLLGQNDNVIAVTDDNNINN
ncbi:uncharacterized protein LOC105785449 [Gossypium raimondii]|uniref:WRC domain-containing protein n=2 Tax=Gossypium raimondii TaxID=29730 RepID=A0A0D2QCR9_GOSRA|nr:uncharacterized protein LOC105785449 [Gossypium raimondii]KJB17209.1 hypothetical protein B456_002G156300 [Gossypium raimondii]